MNGNLSRATAKCSVCGRVIVFTGRGSTNVVPHHVFRSRLCAGGGVSVVARIDEHRGNSGNPGNPAR